MNVLVVHEENDARSLISGALGDKGFRVDGVSDGESAIEKLSQGSYVLVIADVYLSKTGGIQILSWARANRPQLKVILITDSGDSQKMRLFNDLKTNGLLLKPLRAADVVKQVENAMGGSMGEAISADESGFARVPIDDFLMAKKVPYAVYVRTSENKFIRIAQTGEELERTRVETFKKKGIQEFWLPKEDFNHYLQVNQAVVHAATQKGGLKIQETRKAKLIRHACQVAYENLRVVGIQEKSVAQAEEILSKSISAIESGNQVESFLEALQGGASSNYNHAASAALLCALMTKVMGWTIQKNITALVMGAFFHDIGIEELPKVIRDKDPRKLEGQELMIYQQHPVIGAQKLAMIPNMPEEVLKIVAQHHEMGNGQGYPGKLLRSAISPMARILALVNEFCEYLIYAGTSPKNGSAILRLLLAERPDLYDKSTVFALEMVLTHVDISKAKAAYSRETAKMVK